MYAPHAPIHLWPPVLYTQAHSKQVMHVYMHSHDTHLLQEVLDIEVVGMAVLQHGEVTVADLQYRQQLGDVLS